jgi:hypothetical protein
MRGEGASSSRAMPGAPEAIQKWHHCALQRIKFVKKWDFKETIGCQTTLTVVEHSSF